jgi:hypothetical protein
MCLWWYDGGVDVGEGCTVYSCRDRLGRAIAQAVSHWLPTAAARVRARIRLCVIYSGRNGTEACFLRVLRFPLTILIPPTAPYSSSSGAGTIG